ncbi:MAG TPA: CRTAC1 family protein, partial [Thermoanaerobaculia bacterium]|nr:CRTAC1 family protein [Thermoanaerobaculia bacterium]
LSSGERRSGALYENLGEWRFRDVTETVGLDSPIYGMGVAVGDVDSDGFIDLFVSGLGEDRLYRNVGGERFEDVSGSFGLRRGGFSSSAAFLDYDRDGWLDLYVARYVTWSREGDVRCAPDGTNPTYCTPEVYDGAPNVLHRNVGGERFEEVTREAGAWRPDGKSLGVVVLDLEGDGWPDLAVANDTSRNALYRNLGRGADGVVRFEEIGVEAGFAYSESGATRGGMGVDAGDVDGDGRPDVAVGNFAQEMTALYRARDTGNYVDDAAQRGVGLPTLLPLAFGTLLFDRDGDGDLDLALVNGHIEPQIERTRPLHSYAQPPQLFDNDGEGHFAEVEAPEGDAFAAALVGRGLAAADLDGDGDLDLVVTQNGRPARLYRNEANPESWLRVVLRGASGATPYGAVVRVVAGERTWARSLVSGRSYLSAGEPVLTFGLDGAPSVDRVEVRWPDGTEQTVEAPARNRRLVVEAPARETPNP